MNILFLVDNGRVVRGGTYSIFKFAEYLARRNNDVSMICNFLPPFFSKNTAPANLHIHTIPHVKWSFKGIYKLDSVIENIYYRLLTNKYFNGIDFIIGHQLDSGIKAHWLGKKYRIPIATFVFESPEWLGNTYWKQQDIDKSRSEYLRRWQKFQKTMYDSTVVFAISKTTLSMTKKSVKGAVNIDVIYPGIPEYIPSYSGKKDGQIIYIGALSDVKNVDEIIKAIFLTQKPIKLLICGDGYNRQNLKSLGEKLKVKCEFRKVINDEKKWLFISQSKFMIFPSSFEGFGIPPMEALACGIPCVCSDIPIFHEVYGDKVEYFEEHNTKQLAEKMLYLLDDPDYCGRRGEEGKQYVIKKFSWGESARKIEDILEEYSSPEKL